jgi:hypothetical protein
MSHTFSSCKVILLMNELVCGVYIVVINTVSKWDHACAWQTPAKAPSHHRYKRFKP